jgi:hypothetical protein
MNIRGKIPNLAKIGENYVHFEVRFVVAGDVKSLCSTN